MRAPESAKPVELLPLPDEWPSVADRRRIMDYATANVLADRAAQRQPERDEEARFEEAWNGLGVVGGGEMRLVGKAAAFGLWQAALASPQDRTADAWKDTVREAVDADLNRTAKD